MKPFNHTEDRIRQLKPEIKPPAAMDSRILLDAYKAMDKAQTQAPTAQNSGLMNFRRLLMKNTVKFTAAAIILIAATLSLTLFNTTVPTVYALEQTIEALDTMRSIHARMYYPGYEEPVNIWATFHENGQTDALRVSQSDQALGDPHDGPKEIVIKNNIAQVWFKKKCSLLTVTEPKKAAEIGKFFQEIDPKQIVQKLQSLQEKGLARVQIEQPDSIDQPIIITAVFLEEEPIFGRQAIALVDQETKLVISLETTKSKHDNSDKVYNGGDFCRIEFFDYNASFDKSIFSLDIQDDVHRNDQIANVIGLPQGTMTKDEVVVEVVRQFWQALIDKDYDKASQLYDGLAPEKLKEGFGKLEAYKIEIVSVGPVQPHPNPKTRGVIVPCTIQVQANGETLKQPFNRIAVRQVHNHPDRWTIFGGL